MVQKCYPVKASPHVNKCFLEDYKRPVGLSNYRSKIKFHIVLRTHEFNIQREKRPVNIERSFAERTNTTLYACAYAF
jgi:hypothetical protein